MSGRKNSSQIDMLDSTSWAKASFSVKFFIIGIRGGWVLSWLRNVRGWSECEQNGVVARFMF